MELPGNTAMTFLNKKTTDPLASVLGDDREVEIIPSFHMIQQSSHFRWGASTGDLFLKEFE